MGLICLHRALSLYLQQCLSCSIHLVSSLELGTTPPTMPAPPPMLSQPPPFLHALTPVSPSTTSLKTDIAATPENS
ncbi:hypothetical protein BGX38DRAFT_1234426 [Terfezia claveryi]|nr:hypothetical protein BGX38DRAFT_1234426 [Terfezia claveryi]